MRGFMRDSFKEWRYFLCEIFVGKREVASWKLNKQKSRNTICCYESIHIGVYVCWQKTPTIDFPNIICASQYPPKIIFTRINFIAHKCMCLAANFDRIWDMELKNTSNLLIRDGVAGTLFGWGPIPNLLPN